MSRRFAGLVSASFLRFFAASLFGLSFDVTLATALNRLLGLPLIASASVSLVAAAVLMYFVHEFWTFRTSAGRLSASRLAGTVGSGLAALALRTGVLYATSELIGLGDRLAPLQLLAATGLSFVMNYAIVSRVVGGQREARSPT